MSSQAFGALQLFLEVARTQSFSETARHHGLAPSSVARQMTGLEDDLGVRLLNRSTRRVTLTQAGRLYLDHAERVLQELEQARRELTALDTTPSGILRVSAPVVFGRRQFAPLLPEFLERCPDIEIELTLTDQVVDLIEEGLDLAIRIGVMKDSSLVARRLLSMRRVVCASPEYLARHPPIARPEDLQDHHCLIYRAHSTSDLWRPGADVWRFGDARGPIEVPVSGRLRCNNVGALLSMACRGLGLVLIPDWLAQPHLEAGTLTAVLTDYETSPTAVDKAIYAVYPTNRLLPRRVTALVDFLVEHWVEENPRASAASA